MHDSVREYVRSVLRRTGASMGRVLEIGSADVNGSVRSEFHDASEYVGIDWRPGPGVDWVGLAHEYNPVGDDRKFDVVVSTETFEHDPYWVRSMLAGWRALRPGGVWIFTIASSVRAPHDVAVTPGRSWYRGIDPEDVRYVAAHVAPCWDLIVEVTEALRVRDDEDTCCYGYMR